ncbi:MAG TPA: hypothetical protein PKA28_08975 [Methylomusa anaerophila]|uniref:Uncharacterized protein n=1 Tax=Methylomusa anaerophila TaxID=1930071 RepID=A0A348AKU9_9FIRM|nr:hypothetical protein [Methylomusa anaerophila]BBB91697.1 hypothetical protein MAMMFC1_02381 [Methylomusa anaerophila]HML88568.1 hypothetical protein [Methylomusa anaerophila]
MHKQILEQSAQIRKLVFDYKIQDAIKATTVALEQLAAISNDSDYTQKVNILAQNCMIALENKDYLLLADLIFFEIHNMLYSEPEALA